MSTWRPRLLAWIYIVYAGLITTTILFTVWWRFPWRWTTPRPIEEALLRPAEVFFSYIAPGVGHGAPLWFLRLLLMFNVPF